MMDYKLDPPEWINPPDESLEHDFECEFKLGRYACRCEARAAAIALEGYEDKLFEQRREIGV